MRIVDTLSLGDELNQLEVEIEVEGEEWTLFFLDHTLEAPYGVQLRDKNGQRLVSGEGWIEDTLPEEKVSVVERRVNYLVYGE